MRTHICILNLLKLMQRRSNIRVCSIHSLRAVGLVHQRTRCDLEKKKKKRKKSSVSKSQSLVKHNRDARQYTQNKKKKKRQAVG
jgi:hypothetical protein